MKRIAAIDIGTNTILMLIADIRRGSIERVIRDEHAIARIGEGVDARRTILPAAIDRAAEVLQRYRNLCREAECRQIVACGTSAFRDAVNREDALQELAERTGLTIRVLSGEEEAELTYRGAVSGNSGGATTVLDIGGGSTEVIFGEGMRIVRKASIDIGAVRLTERFGPASPPGTANLIEADAQCRERFARLEYTYDGTRCIAVAGTPTTLAALDLRLSQFDPHRVDGHILTRERVDSMFAMLRGLSHEELRSIPQIHPQRADIIVAGTLILRAFLYASGTRTITVSIRGLRYGIALDAGS